MSQQNIRYLCYRLMLKNKNIKSMYNTPTHSLNNTLEVVKFKYFFYYLNDYDFLQNQTELFEIVNKISLQSIIPFTAQKTIKKQLNTFVQYSKHNLKKEIYS